MLYRQFYVLLFQKKISILNLFKIESVYSSIINWFFYLQDENSNKRTFSFYWAYFSIFRTEDRTLVDSSVQANDYEIERRSGKVPARKRVIPFKFRYDNTLYIVNMKKDTFVCSLLLNKYLTMGVVFIINEFLIMQNIEISNS